MIKTIITIEVDGVIKAGKATDTAKSVFDKNAKVSVIHSQEFKKDVQVRTRSMNNLADARDVEKLAQRIEELEKHIKAPDYLKDLVRHLPSKMYVYDDLDNGFSLVDYRGMDTKIWKFDNRTDLEEFLEGYLKNGQV